MQWVLPLITIFWLFSFSAFANPAKGKAKSPTKTNGMLVPAPKRLGSALVPVPKKAKSKRGVVKKSLTLRAKKTKLSTPTAKKIVVPVKRKGEKSFSLSSSSIWKRLSSSLDQKVQVTQLSNGLVAWCRSDSRWKNLEFRLAIAAGSSNDPKGLAGRSRLLAYLLDQELNRPENPARSLFPLGGHRYHLLFAKDWVELRFRLKATALPTSLAHIAKVLKAFAKKTITPDMRNKWAKAAGNFPPPSLSERVDAHLFTGQARGILLRGKKNTFLNLQTFAIQSAYRQLYRASRMRLLVVGGLDCRQFKPLLKKNFGVLAKQDSGVLFPQTVLINTKRKPRSLLFSEEFISLYKLPHLHRNNYLPLLIVSRVAIEEIKHQLVQKLASSFVPFSFLQPSATNGYFAIVLPSQQLARHRLKKLIKKTIGRLQMKQYLPSLEQRVVLYLHELSLELEGLQESGAGTAELLWPQLLLPPAKAKQSALAPIKLNPLFQKLNPSILRELALHFMDKDHSLSRVSRPFSMQRIAFLIGSLFFIWLLLDLLLRRSRRSE